MALVLESDLTIFLNVGQHVIPTHVFEVRITPLNSLATTSLEKTNPSFM